MLCRYRSPDGICVGKYEGYACISSSCSYWMEAHNCEHHDGAGDYCNKHARFGCVGKESCHTLSEYLQAASEAETA